MGKRKTQQKRKERLTEVRIAFENEVNIEMSPPSADGKMSFTHVGTGQPAIPASITTAKAYQRPKGNKILFQADQNPTDIYDGPNEYLAKFESVFAVDTNTNPGSGLSISVSLWLSRMEKNTKDEWVIEPRYPPAFLFNSPVQNPERFAWHNLILRLMSSPDVKKPVAIIVDSSLGILDKINLRTEPVNEDFLLPEGFTLVYASADAGREFIANNLIRQCDVMASAIAREGVSLKVNTWFDYFVIPDTLVKKTFGSNVR
jgi:hypothetical protein